MEYFEKNENKNSITRINGKITILKWHESHQLVNLKFFKIRKYYGKTKEIPKKKFSGYLTLKFSIYFAGNTKYWLSSTKYQNQYHRIYK